MRRDLTAFLLGVGLTLLLLGVVISGFDLVDVLYRDMHSVRLDPLDLNQYPTDEADLPTDKPVVMFFGDSRMLIWEAPRDAGAFTFVNRGISAQTSAQVALRFDAQVRPLAPDILVVQFCVNDLRIIPLFPERKAELIDHCQANLARVVAQAREIGSTVILTTLFPLGEPPLHRRVGWSGEIAEAVDTVNLYIHSLAAEGVLIFDAFALLADENNRLRPELAQDELHTNWRGYEVLNAELVNILQSIES